MTNDQEANMFGQLHDQLNGSHTALRDELLRRLVPCEREATRIRSFAGWRAMVAIAAGIAIIVAMPATFALLGESTVYGLEQLPERTNKVASVYLKSVPLKPDANDTSINEYFAARAGAFWNRSKDANNDLYRASDGKQYLFVDYLAGTARQGTVPPAIGEYWRESVWQKSSLRHLLGDFSAGDFKKLRREMLGSHETDVYERLRVDWRYRFRELLWLDLKTGLAIKTETYSRFLEQPEVPPTTSRMIEYDSEAAQQALTFDPPEGGATTQVDLTLDDFADLSAGQVVPVGSVEPLLYYAVPFALRINDRAVLICWAWFDRQFGEPYELDLDPPRGGKVDLKLTGEPSGTAYTTYHLRADKGKRFHWHWGLAVADGESNIGFDRLQARFVRVGGGDLAASPVEFPREQLQQLVIELQKITLGDDGPAPALFTLAELERAVDQLDAGQEPFAP